MSLLELSVEVDDFCKAFELWAAKVAPSYFGWVSF